MRQIDGGGSRSRTGNQGSHRPQRGRTGVMAGREDPDGQSRLQGRGTMSYFAPCGRSAASTGLSGRRRRPPEKLVKRLGRHKSDGPDLVALKALSIDNLDTARLRDAC